MEKYEPSIWRLIFAWTDTFGNFIHTKKRDPQANLKSPAIAFREWPKRKHKTTISSG